MKAKDLSDSRRAYSLGELLEENAPENPMELFSAWYVKAAANPHTGEANAMMLSTVSPLPVSRIVLLKRFTWEGFYFYTNYHSRKARAIEKQNNVCLSFFWQAEERQVIVCGTADKTSANISDGYFASRPRGSQLGAWASEQSSAVPSRKYLDEKLYEMEKKFDGMEVPRPENWGGYLVRPQSVEFWQGRPNRMHDRLIYTLDNNYNWRRERLAP